MFYWKGEDHVPRDLAICRTDALPGCQRVRLGRVVQFGGESTGPAGQTGGLETGQRRTEDDRGMPQRNGRSQGRSIARTRATVASSDLPVVRGGQRPWLCSEGTEGVKDTDRPDLEARHAPHGRWIAAPS